MRRALYIGVAIHAGEHAAVNGIFEALRIDMQADGLAVHFVSQRGVAMAGQAFFGSWFSRLLAGGWFTGGEELPAVKSRVRATPGAKRFRMVRVDMLSPANLSELNALQCGRYGRFA